MVVCGEEERAGGGSQVKERRKWRGKTLGVGNWVGNRKNRGFRDISRATTLLSCMFVRIGKPKLLFFLNLGIGVSLILWTGCEPSSLTSA